MEEIGKEAIRRRLTDAELERLRADESRRDEILEFFEVTCGL